MRVLLVSVIFVTINGVLGSSIHKREVEPIRRDVTPDIFISGIGMKVFHWESANRQTIVNIDLTA